MNAKNLCSIFIVILCLLSNIASGNIYKGENFEVTLNTESCLIGNLFYISITEHTPSSSRNIGFGYYSAYEPIEAKVSCQYISSGFLEIECERFSYFNLSEEIAPNADRTRYEMGFILPNDDFNDYPNPEITNNEVRLRIFPEQCYYDPYFTYPPYIHNSPLEGIMITQIPEPMTLSLMSIGALLLLRKRRA